MVKIPPANAGDTEDMGSVLESGRSPGGENGNPLQYSIDSYIVQLGEQWVPVTPSTIKKGMLVLNMLPFWQVDIPMLSQGS